MIIIGITLIFQWGAAFVAAVTLTALLVLLAQAIDPGLTPETCNARVCRRSGDAHARGIGRGVCDDAL